MMLYEHFSLLISASEVLLPDFVGSPPLDTINLGFCSSFIAGSYLSAVRREPGGHEIGCIIHAFIVDRNRVSS